MTERDKPELKKFTFDLVGHGHKIPAGEFEEYDIDRAVKGARKLCKSFTLPGWSLVCRETGDSFPAVMFIDNGAMNPKVFK